MTNSGLGRGLGSLIPKLNVTDYADEKRPSFEAKVLDISERVMQMPVQDISSNPYQPRKSFESSDMEDLIESIKTHGILQPLIVTEEGGKYQLIAGERRLKAARLAGLEKVPIIVRSAKNIEKLELALIENVQRQNLNPIEEAVAYKKLIDEFNLTQEEVGKRVGKKRATVANSLRMLDLPQVIKEGLVSRQISSGLAKVILSVEGEKERIKLYNKIIKFSLTVNKAEAEIRKIKGVIESDNKNVEVAEKEDSLRRALGTKVEINKNGPRGQIVIEFYSNQELDEIIKKII